MHLSAGEQIYQAVKAVSTRVVIMVHQSSRLLR
jgi:hypothetical protein